MDYWDEYKEVMKERQLDRAANRLLAVGDYDAAFQLAKVSGLILKKHSEQHYSLTTVEKKGWLQNIYPGNRRLYHDKKRPKPPYVRLPAEWTLLDVVKAITGKKVPHGKTD